ncbi:MAG: hypothetical protein Fur0025_15440 [Oscillatoriaceae cyanobacterium]
MDLYTFPLDVQNSPFDLPRSPQGAITRTEEPRFGGEASTQEQPTYETIDILWILVCSGLVFLMQAGFMCLESGLTRSKNSINVAIKNYTDFGISVALFWAFGFGVMFGRSIGGWIGSSGFWLTSDLDPFVTAFFLFQAMFCGTATTIVSGAVAERMKFGAYLMVAALVSGVIYPLFGHWAWNGANAGELAGWLGKMGFVDFAGSTVVHSVGGWVSLAAVLVLGPRMGRFPPNEPPQKIHGSNLPLSVLGAMILWFGWFGFNGGSTLALNEQVAKIIVNTVLAGVAGMITALVLGWRTRQVPDADLLINGSLAGLVAVTASCHGVTAIGAVIIGGIGGVVCFTVDWLLIRFRIDDAVGAIPVHLGGGIWGTLAVAIFGQPERLGTELNHWQQLGVQVLGIFMAFLLAFGITYLVLKITNRFFPLRVSTADEVIGLNVSEHGAKTEILDLFRVMDFQAKTQDLSWRVPVEPFTEVGQIAERYNFVMDALEEAVTRTEAIVKTATDAIVTFSKPGLIIMSVNPSAEVIFRAPAKLLLGSPISRILAGATTLPETDWPPQIDWGLPPFSSRKLPHKPDFKFPPFFYLPTGFSPRKLADDVSLPLFPPTRLQPQLDFGLPLSLQPLVFPQTKFIPKNDLLRLLQEIIAGGNPKEITGIRFDGSKFPMEVTVSEAKTSQGYFYTAHMRDITHRKQAQASLRESEERFRRLSGATFEGIIVHDRGKIIDVNTALANLFGGEISELIGCDILEIIEPEYRDLVWANTIAGYEKPYEVLALKKDGFLFPAEIEEKVIPYEGRLLRVAAIRDITKRKQAEGALRESEARFRALVEQAADAFVIHDMEGRIIDVNQSACESLGYTRAEMLGLSVADIEDNFESERVKEKWRQLVPGVPTTIEGVQRRKDGTTFPVEIRVGLVDAGVKKLILALCRDVTERKLAEEALLREREKSERLLLNILPEPIAEQLKENQRTIAEGFGEVTVLFADIVGFTKLAARVSPTELVHLLNDIFSRFDLLADRHGLEKIKTIGDAYMVVGGLPVSRPDHAAAVAAMALDMQQEVFRFSGEYREPFSIRIGINTGPVVAGVIGRKKFIYDLWGDTVNVASRMESHGIPGEIQVTESTYMILRDKFAFQHRGAIRVKGKGEMNTYLLAGWLKPN